jgi:NMD protein affecting ribosome stability and mRNA decay
MTVHLVPTPEVFAEQVLQKYGAEAVLHPSNRMTACGKRMAELSVTVYPERVTCKTCAKSAHSQTAHAGLTIDPR